MKWFWFLFFGCAHKRTTWPITPRRGEKGERDGTYICCLDCGAEIPYDWKKAGASGKRPISKPA